MLKAIGKTKHVRAAEGARFAIVASKYNARYVDGMLRGAQRVLRAAGAEQILVVRVPGAFEIPVVAAKLASGHSPRFAVIICLGVILRGETTHAQHIGETVSQSLAQIQVQSGVPIIHEVLLVETAEQAKARCLSREHNRGEEAARTALEMHRVMMGLSGAEC